MGEEKLIPITEIWEYSCKDMVAKKFIGIVEGRCITVRKGYFMETRYVSKKELETLKSNYKTNERIHGF